MPAPVNEPAFREFARSEIEQSIPARFAAQVARHPERAAVSCGGMTTTYRDLDRYSNALAHEILDRLGPGSEAVALLFPQGLDLAAAILAVLKAGKFYLGLDAAHSAERLAGMTGEVRARLIVSSPEYRDTARLLAGPGGEVLLADDSKGADDRGEPGVRIAPGDLAYVFFTSGSTGRPKGVVDSHRNVLHNVMRYTNTLRIESIDRMSLLQTAGFSGSVSSLFGAILNGACSCPIDPRTQDSARLAQWLRDERITIYHSVPALFRHVVRGGGFFPDVRIVRLEGDQAARPDLDLFGRHFPAHARLVNGLGTTETGLVRQFFAVGTDDVPGGVLPVGYSVPDMEVSVLDSDRRALPPGEVGEIAVRSRYLAVGYWENAALTAQRFLADSVDPEFRTYLTGDLGRMRGDGCLEHLGRNDSRIKLRGQAVELVEVESALRELPWVTDAAAALDASGQNPRLVAYYVPADGATVTAGDLRREVASKLPSFMIPSVFVALPALPYTENGKLDRRALPKPDGGRPELAAPYVAPRNLVERQVAYVWQEILGVSPIGALDEFFDLGGDSLAAMTMLAQVRRDLGVELPPGVLLSAPTVAGFAARIAAEHAPPSSPIVEVQAGRGSPNLFYLHGDYVFGGLYCHRLAHEMGPDVAFYSVAPCGCDGADAPATFTEMAERHLAALRRVQPSGPYFLGGTCNGGLIAYEMARRLAAEGETVKLLALFASTASHLRFRWLRRLVGTICTPLGYSARHQQAVFLRAREILVRMGGRSPLGLLQHILRKSLLMPRELAKLRLDPAGAALALDLREHFLAAEYSYIPDPYAGPVLLLWPEDEPESAKEALRRWRGIAPRVTLKTLSGTHHGCLTSDVHLLARELATAMAAASA